MKKIILTFFCFFMPLMVCAQEAPEKLTKAQRHRLQLVQTQDDLLDFLLQTPFELRQYIFPMLSEKKSIPKKIKTHPDVLVWKGKRPTRIAKKFENDKELLEFLPAQFYIYLAPEMWPDEFGQNLPKEGNPNQVLLNFLHTAQTETVPSDEILVFKRGLEIFDKNLTQNQREILKQKKQPVYLKDFFLFADTKVESALKEKGLDSAPELARKIDTLAKAYRLYTKGKVPPTGPEQKLVKEYFSLVPMLFKNSDFEVLIDPTLYSD